MDLLFAVAHHCCHHYGGGACQGGSGGRSSGVDGGRTNGIGHAQGGRDGGMEQDDCVFGAITVDGQADSLVTSSDDLHLGCPNHAPPTGKMVLQPKLMLLAIPLLLSPSPILLVPATAIDCCCHHCSHSDISTIMHCYDLFTCKEGHRQHVVTHGYGGGCTCLSKVQNQTEFFP